MCFKSRNRRFEACEFGRWILCGLRSAYTVEEYVSFGNSFEINDYSANKISNWKLYPFKTTKEFLALIEKLQGQPCLNVHLGNDREVYRPVKKRTILDYRSEPEYYVLSHDCIGEKYFFCGFKGKGKLISFQNNNPNIKTFPTGNAAEKYLEKHINKLYGYEVNKISNA